MFNIFKTKVPTGQTKEVQELESWTVSWRTHVGYQSTDVYSKVFIIHQEALGFKKAIEDAGKFLKVSVWTEIVKN